MTETVILLTLSVYQLSISSQLPNKSGAIPLIGWCYILFNHPISEGDIVFSGVCLCLTEFVCQYDNSRTVRDITKCSEHRPVVERRPSSKWLYRGWTVADCDLTLFFSSSS